MRTRLKLAALIAALAVVAAGCGGSGDIPSTASDARTIKIEMRDTAFVPDTITVPAGEEVRLEFHNRDRVDHDAFIGDDMAQDDHEAEMKDNAVMHHEGGDSDAITVGPGETDTLTHTFEAGDNVLIGCHQPGHYAAGMKITVKTT